MERVTRTKQSPEKTILDFQFEIEMKSCEKRKILSFVGVTFGVIADCDLGSEWLRFMGYIRTYFYVVGRDGLISAALDL